MGSLSIRSLNETDYQGILVGWWKDWGWETAPSKDFLPDDGKGGLIVFDGDIPVCAGFLYITNSKIGWIDWIVSSKTYRLKPHRKEAIKLLIETLTNTCESIGCKYCYSLFNNNNLSNAFQSVGYVKGASYTGEMIKIL